MKASVLCRRSDSLFNKNILIFMRLLIFQYVLLMQIKSTVMQTYWKYYYYPSNWLVNSELPRTTFSLLIQRIFLWQSFCMLRQNAGSRFQVKWIALEGRIKKSLHPACSSTLKAPENCSTIDRRENYQTPLTFSNAFKTPRNLSRNRYIQFTLKNRILRTSL